MDYGSPILKSIDIVYSHFVYLVTYLDSTIVSYYEWRIHYFITTIRYKHG